MEQWLFKGLKVVFEAGSFALCDLGNRFLPYLHAEHHECHGWIFCFVKSNHFIVWPISTGKASVIFTFLCSVWLKQTYFKMGLCMYVCMYCKYVLYVYTVCMCLRMYGQTRYYSQDKFKWGERENNEFVYFVLINAYNTQVGKYDAFLHRMLISLSYFFNY